MKPIARRGLLRTLLAMLAVPAVGQAQDFPYTLENGTNTITRHTGSGNTTTAVTAVARQAQDYICATNDGSIAITKYTGYDSAVTNLVG